MGKKPNAATANKAELLKESSGFSPKKVASKATRRSGRIQNQNPPPRNQEIQPVVEINLIEDDRAYDENVDEGPGLNGKSLEEKIDYILQAVDKLKNKDSRSYSQDDVSTTYRNLYFDSQKKIETLTKENYELAKKAEVATGKLEGYAESSRVWSEVLGQVKDLFMVSNLPKASPKAKELSPQTNVENISSIPNEANGDVETRPNPKRSKKPKLKKDN